MTRSEMRDNVKVIVSMYDSSNVFIGTDYGYTLMDILTPAQRSFVLSYN